MAWETADTMPNGTARVLADSDGMPIGTWSSPGRWTRLGAGNASVRVRPTARPYGLPIDLSGPVRARRQPLTHETTPAQGGEGEDARDGRSSR
ncbi:hypothetical protein GCM10010430_77520 [Kitasatospora cystarginea]|uniref:Uncharacterized protein n=1 Tax=Kitasatospora cystarginea TaxID=58350 RepID=A0ABN3F1A0_9ACTN